MQPLVTVAGGRAGNIRVPCGLLTPVMTNRSVEVVICGGEALLDEV